MPSFFDAATFAKLSDGRTFGARVIGDPLGGNMDLGELGVDAPPVVAAVGGVPEPWVGGRSVAVRELVRDMVFRSLVASLSRSSRSETSLSRVLTSTGLAAPNGLGFVFPEGGVGPIFGEDNGLGEAEGFPERGRSSNFLRVI